MTHKRETVAPPKAAQSPPDWFRQEMREGVFLTLSLCLRSRPQSNEAHVTANVWTDCVWYAVVRAGAESRITKEALQHGFLVLQAKSSRWPAPAELISALAAAASGDPETLH